MRSHPAVHRSMRLTIGAGIGAALAIARPAGAQEALLGTTTTGSAVTYAAWNFDTPVPQGSRRVRGLAQAAAPLAFRVNTASGWAFEARGAVAWSHVNVDSGATRSSLVVAGLTDVKLRVSHPVADGRVLVTAGVNLPTGTAALNAGQTAALQVIAAPGFQMPVAALGLGPGATAGLLRAFEWNEWAVALGTSAELRSEYTAVELALASGTSRTIITPGAAFHFTMGADRSVGPHRIAVQVVGDAFTSDRVVVDLATGTRASTTYALGPQFAASSRIDLSAPAWRSAAVDVTVRHRTAFRDAEHRVVPGSAGTYFEAAISGIRGGPTGPALILAADARYHTGLPFTDALVGAKTTAIGVTIGVEVPSSARTTWRLSARPQYGAFDTGRARSSGYGVVAMATLSSGTVAR